MRHESNNGCPDDANFDVQRRFSGAPAARSPVDRGNTNAGEEGLTLELHDIVAITLVELARLEERRRVELRVEVPRRRCGGTAKTRTTARNGWFSSFTELVGSLRNSCIGWRWCGGRWSTVEHDGGKAGSGEARARLWREKRQSGEVEGEVEACASSVA